MQLKVTVSCSMRPFREKLCCCLSLQSRSDATCSEKSDISVNIESVISLFSLDRYRCSDLMHVL
jgi:hypothetical protein